MAGTWFTGLDVGGPYSVTVRHPGYQSQMRDGQMLTLSQNLTLDFRLERQTIILSTVSVTTETDPILSPDRTGAATVISDSALRRLPSLDRTFTDFVILSPEVSDAGPGLSGGGVNNRLNNIQIDGASENDLFGLGDTGQPGGQARGKVDRARVRARVSGAARAVRRAAGQLRRRPRQRGHARRARTSCTAPRSSRREARGSRGTSITFATRSTANGSSASRSAARSCGSRPLLRGSRVPAAVTSRLPVRISVRRRSRILRRPPTSIGSSTLLGGYGIDAGSAGPARNANPLRNIFARLDIAPSVNNRLVSALQLRTRRGRRAGARPDAAPPNVECARVHVREGQRGRAAVHELRRWGGQRADRRLQPHSRPPQRGRPRAAGAGRRPDGDRRNGAAAGGLGKLVAGHRGRSGRHRAHGQLHGAAWGAIA